MTISAIAVLMLMGCAMLWWIGRGLSLTARLIVTAVTLIVIAAVLIIERSV